MCARLLYILNTQIPETKQPIKINPPQMPDPLNNHATQRDRCVIMMRDQWSGTNAELCSEPRQALDQQWAIMSCQLLPCWTANTTMKQSNNASTSALHWLTSRFRRANCQVLILTQEIVGWVFVCEWAMTEASYVEDHELNWLTPQQALWIKSLPWL